MKLNLAVNWRREEERFNIISTRPQITALLCSNILGHIFLAILSSVTDNYLPVLQSVTAHERRAAVNDYLFPSVIDLFI